MKDLHFYGQIDCMTLCRKYTQSFTCFVISILLLLAQPVNAQRNNPGVSEKTQHEAKAIYQVLIAEMYHQYGEDQLAVKNYQKVLSISDDIEVAKRATILSTATASFNEALIAAKRWVELTPETIEARQYLALLHLRHQHIDASVKQLHLIRNLVAIKFLESKSSKKEASREGLAFLGSMLAQEAHHKKALTVFETYLEKYKKNSKSAVNEQAQQNLILANLAMNAKDYQRVVSALSDKNNFNYSEQNRVDAISLKAKALRKLHRPKEAITLLESIQNNQHTPDSSRLELVRLWVLNNKKNKALSLLLKLVAKHNKNHELLKSLVALQLDLKHYNEVEKNIELLRSQPAYKNDAHYFTGELHHLKKQPLQAIQSFEEVAGGAFLKLAHKKLIRLKHQEEGREALDIWFQEKLNKAKKIGDQAYWLKLHADSLFDNKQYQKAMNAYNRAIRLSPKETRYRYHRALLNERLKNYDGAEKDLNYIIKRRENDADALNALGYMLIENTDRISEAKGYIKRAFALRPNDPVILDSLGWAMFKTGEFELAKTYLEKAYEKIKNPEVASHLIQTLSALGLKQQAKQVYKEIKKQFPKNKKIVSLQEYLH